MTETHTIDALLNQASAKLSTALHLDSQTARFEARLLLAEQLGCDNSFFFSRGDTPLPSAQITLFWNWIERRAAGEPVAYITGQRGFWRYQFQTAPTALIPRPDTEQLVEQALATLAAHSITDVADLGTGTGAIGLSLAAEHPDLRVYLVDASAPALALAQQNQRLVTKQAGTIAPTVLIHSHWLTAFGLQSLDMIVSNPPYIAPDDPHLKQGDLRFEPTDALIAAEQGLADFACIIDQATTRLRPGGWLLFEHGASQGEAVTRLLSEAGFSRIRTYCDLAGHPRVTEGRLTKA